MITYFIIFLMLAAGVLIYLMFAPVSPQQSLPKRPEFPIRGINMRGLTDEDLGFFQGTVRCDQNEYDKFALAVYSSTGKHLGYLPRGREALFNAIAAQGGVIPCEGTVEKGDDDKREFYYGYVDIDSIYTKFC